MARHPGLVYAIVTGYGIEGDDANRRAYDIAAFWARSGIAHALTPQGGDLPFQRGGMGDHSVAMTAAAMISAALVHKERTGEGQFVTTSLLRQGAYTIGFDVNVVLMWGHNISVGNRATMGNPAINNYTAGDGRRFWIVGLEGGAPLAAARPRGRASRVARPTSASRRRWAARRTRASSSPRSTRSSRRKSLDEWAEIFETEPDFFWSPVNSVNDLVVDPQFYAAGGVVTVPDETDGG